MPRRTKNRSRKKWLFLILCVLMIIVIVSVVWHLGTQTQSVEQEKERYVEAEIVDDYYDSEKDVAVFLLNLSSSHENVNFSHFKIKDGDTEIPINELVPETGMVYGLEIAQYKDYAEKYGYYEITLQLFFNDVITGEFLEGGEVVVTPPKVDGSDKV